MVNHRSFGFIALDIGHSAAVITALMLCSLWLIFGVYDRGVWLGGDSPGRALFLIAAAAKLFFLFYRRLITGFDKPCQQRAGFIVSGAYFQQFIKGVDGLRFVLEFYMGVTEHLV